MVISKDYILIHLQKCGGTYLKKIIEKYSNGKNMRPEHNGVKDIKPHHKNKLLIGTIRNPWSWYVSLYHSHYKNGTSFFKNTFKNKKNFNEWVIGFLNEKNKTYHDLNFKKISHHNIGAYTYRMLKCYTTDGSLNADKISQKINIIKIEDNLGKGFLYLLDKNNILLRDNIKTAILDTKKIHTSKHKHYSEYYTPESIELVKNKDKIIIDLFDYEFNK